MEGKNKPPQNVDSTVRKARTRKTNRDARHLPADNDDRSICPCFIYSIPKATGAAVL